MKKKTNKGVMIDYCLFFEFCEFFICGREVLYVDIYNKLLDILDGLSDDKAITPGANINFSQSKILLSDDDVQFIEKFLCKLMNKS